MTTFFRVVLFFVLLTQDSKRKKGSGKRIFPVAELFKPERRENNRLCRDSRLRGLKEPEGLLVQACHAFWRAKRNPGRLQASLAPMGGWEHTTLTLYQ